MTQYYSRTPKNDDKDRIEIEVGGFSDSAKFQPHVKIKRWDDEVNFGVRLTHTEANPTILTDGDIVTWTGAKTSARFYPTTEGEGGFEFEVILTEAPPAGKIRFTIDHKGLVYHYQPPLTDEIKIGDEGGRVTSVTATDAYDIDGNVLIHRPENIVGSYAVYASEKKDNLIGGKLYRTGKVGHIKRPKITDANGNWAWEELSINGNNLTITIPQSFLDTAVYPIVSTGVNFGHETHSATAASVYDEVHATAATPASGGTGDSISIWSRYGTAATSGVFGLYTVSDSAVVANSQTARHTYDSATPATITENFGATKPVIVNGTAYWISVFGGDSGSAYIYIYYDAGSAGDGMNTNHGNAYTGTENLPSTITPTTEARLYTIWCTYTEATSVNETDTATITENKVAEIVTTANKSESITLTENKISEIVTTVNKSESVTLSESAGVTVGSPQANKSESITVSDAPAASILMSSSALQDITLSESVTGAVGLPQVLGEGNITASENIGAQIATGISAVENIALSETAAAEVGSPQVGQSESVTLSENALASLDANIAAAESVTTAEFIALETSAHQIAPADNISVSEAITSEAFLPGISANENVSLSDGALLVVGTSQIAISESVTIADTPALSISDAQINASDAITVSDVSAQEVGTAEIGAVDNLSLSEAIVAAVSAPEIGAVENVSISESVNLGLATPDEFNVTAQDSVTISEYVAAEIGINIDKYEAITLSESASALFGCDVYVYDNIQAADDSSASLPGVGFSVSVSDGISTSEYLSCVFMIAVPWTLHSRSTAWTLESRSLAWTLKDRAQTWTLDTRTNTWTLSARSTAWTLKEDDR